jgi:thiosulfate reductase cytochrome b subunit
MADAARAAVATARVPAPASKHPGAVRITHWITAACFFALLLSGANIVISHPRFYWGETGNALTPALFELPIPASRASVRTGYDFVLPDQNGWSRSLHFEAAWLLVFAGVSYGVFALVTRHLHNKLLPARSDLRWAKLSKVLAGHLRFQALPNDQEAGSYNVLQRLAYLLVVFVLFPLMIWTGLAMSPAMVSVFPGAVTVLGGHQSARTIHFIVSVALVAFLFVHVLMVYRAGFRDRTLAMITGRRIWQKERL